MKVEKIVEIIRKRKCADSTYCRKVRIQVHTPRANQHHAEVNWVLCKCSNKGSVYMEVGRSFEEGDPEHRAGTGTMAPLLQGSGSLTEKVTSERFEGHEGIVSEEVWGGALSR